jgi:hypothetical protein
VQAGAVTGHQRYFVVRPDGSGALAPAGQVDWEAVLADPSYTVTTGRGASLHVLTREEVEALRDVHRAG